jgi:hypothetical protein
MNITRTLFFGLSASLFSGILFAKPLPTKYAEMENGHVTTTCLTEIKHDSEIARKTLEPARYEAIVKDPSKATTDSERIAALAAREIIYLVDRSGSMSGTDEDPSGQNRKNWTLWNSALEAGKSLFEVAVSLDSNGKLDVMMWDQDTTGPRFVHQEVSKLAELEAMFKDNQPFGYTPLAEALDKVYQQKLKGMLERSEPFTVVVLTDGVPSNGVENTIAAQEKVFNFFKTMVATHELQKPGRETLAAFSFVQAGDEPSAEEFLTALDDKMKEGYTDSKGVKQSGLGIDIIDYKKDNFIFGTGAYKGLQGVGPLGIFWGAMFD